MIPRGPGAGGGGSRHPLQHAGDGVCGAPCLEFGVGAYTVAQHGLIVFDTHDFLGLRSFVFEPEDGFARLVGQHGGDPVGHPFEIAVVGRAFRHVDHVDLPKLVVGVGIPCVPFEALLARVEQVAVFDAVDAAVFGQPGHGGEAVRYAQGR